jgi:O-antigen/teichoic acid export membrane protein
MSDAPTPTTTPGESDAKAASKEAGIYVYSRLAASLLMVGVLAVIGRTSTQEERTYIIALITVYETAVALGSLGLADVVLYYVGRTPEKAAHIVRQASLLLLYVSVPAIVIACVAGQLAFDLGSALPWLAIALLVELPTQPAVNQLLAVKRAGLASALYIGFAFFRPIAVLVPVLTGLGLEWIPVFVAILSVTRLFAHIAIVRRIFTIPAHEPKRAWISRQALYDMFFFSLPAGMAVLGGKLNPQIDKYVVGLYDETALGLYGFAAWELPLVTMIPYAIGAVMQARYSKLFMEGKHETMRLLWLQTIRKTQVIVLPLAMMFIALAEETMVVVFGPEQRAAAPIFQIFTLTMLQRVTAYGPMLQSIGETRALYVTNTLLLVTNLVLCYPFTIWFGMNGAAISTVVATVPPLLFTLWRIKGGLRTTWGGVMPWAHYVATLSLASVLALALWYARDYFPERPGARLGLGALGYVIVFFTIARVTRLVNREDARYLTDWLSLKMLRR